MKKSFIIHPFLFAIYPILFLFSHNIEQVSYFQILLPLTIVLGFTLLLVLLSRLIFRGINKIAIIISVAIILFFSYGHVYNLIVDQYIGNFEIGRHRYLWLTWGLLFSCSTYLIIKTHRDLHNFTNTLNIMALSLIVISLVNIGVYKFKTKTIWQDTSKSIENIKTDTTDLGEVSVLRDIYYIILDGYASSITLKDQYDYDNKKFNDYLITKGFYVTTKSHSNYPMSFLSIASSLNMKYLNYLTDVIGVERSDVTLPYQMIQDSKVMNFLKLKGYKYIHFSSGYGPTDHNRHADLNVHGRGLGNETMMVLAQTTMLKPFESLILSFERKRILDTFSKLAKIHKIEGPKFIFAHIISPHHPYLFGKNGEPVPIAQLRISDGSGIWELKENYLNQLIFINKKVEKLVDEILLKSEVPPIIILQADHGSASSFPGPYGSEAWGHPSETMMRERLSILNAYYLPSGGNDLLYESITPVNTFRVIFNSYFDANYRLLEDKSYYSSYKRPYDFISVTDIIK